ncbi:hypothetical protein DSL72_005142 [Monilinia vaccinii-corymbosi]|uniref:Uncharacterized protein n=1 Tax=Monilinia vaccinii-corymbosi TaxID=61207 RepID=A0A8A3PEU7_9HELO|nr:hypothetical protein DSL72_005142 [Monilinia vaccinii-corymbosi]
MINGNGSSSLTLDDELSGPGLLRIGRFKFRAKTDNLPQDWWIASTAFPLIAATIGPLANVLSISALVTKWRANLPDDGQLPSGSDENGVGIPDPEWWEISTEFMNVADFKRKGDYSKCHFSCMRVRRELFLAIELYAQG